MGAKTFARNSFLEPLKSVAFNGWQKMVSAFSKTKPLNRTEFILKIILHF